MTYNDYCQLSAERKEKLTSLELSYLSPEELKNFIKNGLFNSDGLPQCSSIRSLDLRKSNLAILTHNDWKPIGKFLKNSNVESINVNGNNLFNLGDDAWEKGFCTALREAKTKNFKLKTVICVPSRNATNKERRAEIDAILKVSPSISALFFNSISVDGNFLRKRRQSSAIIAPELSTKSDENTNEGEKTKASSLSAISDSSEKIPVLQKQYEFQTAFSYSQKKVQQFASSSFSSISTKFERLSYFFSGKNVKISPESEVSVVAQTEQPSIKFEN